MRGFDECGPHGIYKWGLRISAMFFNLVRVFDSGGIAFLSMHWAGGCIFLFCFVCFPRRICQGLSTRRYYIRNVLISCNVSPHACRPTVAEILGSVLGLHLARATCSECKDASGTQYTQADRQPPPSCYKGAHYLFDIPAPTLLTTTSSALHATLYNPIHFRISHPRMLYPTPRYHPNVHLPSAPDTRSHHIQAAPSHTKASNYTRPLIIY